MSRQIIGSLEYPAGTNFNGTIEARNISGSNIITPQSISEFAVVNALYDFTLENGSYQFAIIGVLDETTTTVSKVKIGLGNVTDGDPIDLLTLIGLSAPPSSITEDLINERGQPSGGTAGQHLAKIDGTDYNSEWVDAGGGGDVEEAPINGSPYSRQNEGWVSAATKTSDLTNDAGFIGDAPIDGNQYSRKDAVWDIVAEGMTTFIELTDTPADYLGEASKVVSVNTVADALEFTVLDKTAVGLSNVDNTSDASKPVSTATQIALDLKEDSVAGRGLSEEDFTTILKGKLDGIAPGAEVNTQSDWNQSVNTEDSFILNKPYIVVAASVATIEAGTVDDEYISPLGLRNITKIAIGNQTTVDQGTGAIAIGNATGVTSQGASSVAIGDEAGNITQGSQSIAVGNFAGYTGQASQAISVGLQAGQTNQSLGGVAVGYRAGQNTQGNDAVAVGDQAGQTSQGASSVAVGDLTGNTNQGAASVAVGSSAGNSSQGIHSVAIGYFTAQTTQGAQSVAIGRFAGSSTQGADSIAIGSSAGQTSQGASSVAIGDNAGATSQGATSVAIGALSKGNGLSSVAIGFEAGGTSARSIAIGAGAGKSGQSIEAVSIGNEAGWSSQGDHSVALGNLAGRFLQGNDAVAIGDESGNSSQGDSSVAIGCTAGNSSQGAAAVAIGFNAAEVSQGSNGVAIGNGTGKTSQSASAVAIGFTSGQTTQGAGGVAIGSGTGKLSQGSTAVAIGSLAGNDTQGIDGIAIGRSSGQVDQGANGIAIGSEAGFVLQEANGVHIKTPDFDFEYVPSTNTLDISNPLGDLQFTINGESATSPNRTSAQLDSLVDASNTTSKATGTVAYNTTTGTPVWASGPLAADTWNDATGAVVNTPI